MSTSSMYDEQDYFLFLLDADELQAMAEEWPADMVVVVAVDTRQTGRNAELTIHLLRSEELPDRMADIGTDDGVARENILVVPEVSGFGTRRLRFSQEQSIVKKVEHELTAGELCHDAQSYTLNYQYAVDEGLDPQASMRGEIAPASEPEEDDFVDIAPDAHQDRDPEATAEYEQTPDIDVQPTQDTEVEEEAAEEDVADLVPRFPDVEVDNFAERADPASEDPEPWVAEAEEVPDPTPEPLPSHEPETRTLLSSIRHTQRAMIVDLGVMEGRRHTAENVSVTEVGGLEVREVPALAGELVIPVPMVEAPIHDIFTHAEYASVSLQGDRVRVTPIHRPQSSTETVHESKTEAPQTEVVRHVQKTPRVMWIALLVLAACAIGSSLFGYFLWKEVAEVRQGIEVAEAESEELTSSYLDDLRNRIVQGLDDQAGE